MTEERMLVARMLRGDQAAFLEFFEANVGPLFRFALPRVGGDANIAEDVVQATLCRAMRKLSTYRGEAALLTWVTTICRREIADWFERRHATPPMLELTDDLPEIRAAIESMSTNVAADAMRRKEVAEMVQMILDRLPSRYGDVLEWKYIDGLSVAEIAGRLGLASKAAESLLTRARVAFRDAFTAAEVYA